MSNVALYIGTTKEHKISGSSINNSKKKGDYNELYKIPNSCKYNQCEHKNRKDIMCSTQLGRKYCEKLIVNNIVNKFKELYNKKINALNSNHAIGLLGIYNSWIEIPIMYWFKMGKTWWDIRILINIYSAGINQSEMENPYPVYPTNPYTRKLVDPHDLKLLLKRSIELNIKLNIALNVFLKLPKIILNKCYKICAVNMRYLIVSELSKKLRYRLINYKNSQDCYCGYWVPKRTKKTTFEQLYSVIRNTPMYCNSEGTLIGDPSYLYAMVLINDLEPEQYVLE